MKQKVEFTSGGLGELIIKQDHMSTCRLQQWYQHYVLLATGDDESNDEDEE